MSGGWTMPVYFFRSEPGAAELRRLARRESGRVCQRVLLIANMLEGMEHEEAARLAGLSRSAAYEWHNRYEEDGLEGLRDRPRPGRQPRVDSHGGRQPRGSTAPGRQPRVDSPGSTAPGRQPRVDSPGSTAPGRRRDECAAQGTDCRWRRAGAGQGGGVSRGRRAANIERGV